MEEEKIEQKRISDKIILILIASFFISGVLSIIIYNNISTDDEITILSWNVKDLRVQDYKNDAIMLRLSSFIKQYDVIALQGVNNFYENNDSRCLLNSFAPSTEEYHLIENQFHKYLPKYYNISVSEYIGDQRYVFIWNTKKIKNFNHGNFGVEGIFFEGEQEKANASMCSSEEKAGSMLRDPYFGHFETNNMSFSILGVYFRDDLNTSIIESKYVDRIMKAVYAEEPEFKPIFIVGTINLCYDDLRGYFLGYKPENADSFPDYPKLVYQWLFNETNCPNSNAIFVNGTVVKGNLVKEYPNDLSISEPVVLEIGTKH